MFVFAGNTRLVAKRQQRYVIGGGIFDWIPSLTSVSRALGSAGNFVSANKDTIKNVADVVGNVAKSSASTASAVKQIVDVVKARRATAKAAALPIPLEKAMSEKSLEFLKSLTRQHAHSAEAPPATLADAALPDINSRIAGAGFKTLARPLARQRARTHRGDGLILGPNSPFKNIPILGAIL
jgi:hypothetical protein